MTRRRFDWAAAGVLRSIVALSLLAVAAACQQGNSDATPIGQAELMHRIGAQGAPLILDVRTPDEYAAGHVEGARNIPFDQLANRLDELGVAKGDEVVVYCKSGRRGGMAEATLTSAGYTNVRALEGHMDGWSKAGHPVDR